MKMKLVDKKFGLGILISGVAIVAILNQFDIRELKRILEIWNPMYLLPMIFSNLWAMALFGYRWFFLMEKKISFSSALLSSFLGVGSNLILPARGGDLLRVYYCKTESNMSYPFVISRIFIEKVMDLTIVLLIGSISFLLLGVGGGNSTHPVGIFISGFVVFGILSALLLLKYARTFLENLGVTAFSWIGKEDYFLKKISPHIREFSDFLTWKRLGIPILLTFPTWLGGYAVTYFFQSYLIGIPLDYLTILFIVFLGAMGVAIPSAPSGIGIFHASVISGFLLLGKSGSDGFLFATAVHLLQFLVLGTCAIAAYSIWIRKRMVKSE